MPANQSRPAKKTTADKPAPVSLNFDTWSRDQAVEPYAVVIGGKRYESLDPMDLDFRALSAAIDGDPEVLFNLLFPDDATEMLKHKIPLGAMVQFNEALVVHFGLEDFIAAQS